MSTINIAGVLIAPIEGYILSNASIKFVALENYGFVLAGSSSVFTTDVDGNYDFDVYYVPTRYIRYLVLAGIYWGSYYFLRDYIPY